MLEENCVRNTVLHKKIFWHNLTPILFDYYFKLLFQDKLDKMKVALDRLEAEKRSLQEELNRIENRSTKLELQRMSAEGDLQRLQMMLQEKDSNIQVST